MILALMLTKQCNFHCGHCMVDSTYEYSCVSGEIIEKWFEILERECPDAVYLLGGEPTLHMDLIQRLVERIKLCCKNITIFTNGSFLLNEKRKKQIEAIEVTIRISNDRYHRMQWSERLRQEIEESGYLVITKEDDATMIPVGRAYEEYKHLQHSLDCSLLTGCYDERYKNGHRYMVMLDGSVNLYCATIEGSLANVFEDECITYDLLVEREKMLHNYLFQEVIHCKEDTYMAVMCNRCSKYKVTDSHILYENQIVAETKDYREKR